MKLNRIGKGTMLALTAMSIPSAAWADPNVDLMKSLYTKIGQAVGVGTNDPQTGESFLVLANPGILLDPNLDPTKPADRYRLSRTLDKAVLPDWIYKTGSQTVYDIYGKVLDYHESPDIKPTAAQVAKYKQACVLIFADCQTKQPGTYTKGFLKYQSTQKELATAAKAAEDYQRNNKTDDLPPDLATDLQRATDNYDLLGNRVKIEAARASLNTYEHIDPDSWWGELAGKYSKNSPTYSGNRYGSVNVYPSYPVWLDMARSWTSLTLSQTDLEQTTHNSSSSVGGGLSAGWGPWSVGADYSHQENRTYFQLDASGLAVTMELMRVDLDRPWIDDSVFQSRAWQWLKGSAYDKKFISDGADAASGKTPAGVMPFIPTGVLLARRVSLTGAWSHDLKTTFDSSTSGGASVGWGPFSFSGRYNATDSSSYIKANAAGNTVSWDAPQIIGFFVEVLPKSPDTDPCYHYASSTKPVPSDCKAQPIRAGVAMTDSSKLLKKAHDILNRRQAFLIKKR